MKRDPRANGAGVPAFTRMQASDRRLSPALLIALAGVAVLKGGEQQVYQGHHGDGAGDHEHRGQNVEHLHGGTIPSRARMRTLKLLSPPQHTRFDPDSRHGAGTTKAWRPRE